VSRDGGVAGTGCGWGLVVVGGTGEIKPTGGGGWLVHGIIAGEETARLVMG
jgi:hypothetical protein